MPKAKQKAFTLIELLVVIAIIGLLATLSVIALNNARAKSRDAKRLADAKQFETAMELYFNAAGHYPSVAEFESGRIEYNSGSGTTTYMQVIPTAPTPADGSCTTASNAYTYNAPADGSTYTLDFCVAQANSDLGGGELTVWPGGISGGNGGNGGGNGGGNSTPCGSGPACPSGMHCVADNHCEGTLAYQGGPCDANGENCGSGGGYYRTVKVGNQTWMKDNINAGTMITSGVMYSDYGYGYDGIGGTDDDCIDASGNGSQYFSCQGASGLQKYCHGNSLSSCNNGFGGLYEWAEAMGFPAQCNVANFSSGSSNCGTGTTYTINQSGHRGICPSGWHIPTIVEMSILGKYADDDHHCTINMDYGGSICSVAGTRLKASASDVYPWDGTNDFGFSGITINGMRYYNGGFNGDKSVFMWTSTPTYDQTSSAGFLFDHTFYNGTQFSAGSQNRSNGLAVRCIKDGSESTCTPDCSGKACGAPDGCDNGGVCANGDCNGYGTCTNQGNNVYACQ